MNWGRDEGGSGSYRRQASQNTKCSKEQVRRDVLPGEGGERAKCKQTMRLWTRVSVKRRGALDAGAIHSGEWREMGAKRTSGGCRPSEPHVWRRRGVGRREDKYNREWRNEWSNSRRGAGHEACVKADRRAPWEHFSSYWNPRWKREAGDLSESPRQRSSPSAMSCRPSRYYRAGGGERPWQPGKGNRPRKNEAWASPPLAVSGSHSSRGSRETCQTRSEGRALRTWASRPI